MARDSASETAELAALARASLTREAESIRGADAMAIDFLRPALRMVIAVEPLRRLVRALLTGRMPGAYGFVLARSNEFDAFVEREICAGAKQVVVLGAGYDSRAYRFGTLIAEHGARVFEVDAPPTSTSKQAKVKKLMGALPSHVAYVKVDFDREAVDGPLLAAGYDPRARTAFLWEGVTFYLSAEAVDAVLTFVAQSSGPESAIIFDYLFRSVVDGTSKAFGAAESVAYVQRKGEPFTFGLDETDVATFITERGLALDADLRADLLEARHVRDHASRSSHKIAEFYAIACARSGSRRDP